jgi:hypothetical protein
MKRAITATVATMMMTVAAHAQTPNQPSGRDLFIKSLHVTGADTILAKHTNMKMTGTFNLPEQGISAPLENSRSSKGAFHLVIDIPGFGAVEQGYADGTSYSINPAAGATIQTGDLAAAAKRQAMWMDTPDAYASITNEGMTKFQDKDAWKVSMVTKDGLKLVRYFDPTTGYAVATVSTQDVGQGPAEITSVLSDYKDFGGLKFPGKQSQSAMGQQTEFVIDKIEFDNVPDSVFELPASVKAIKKF